MKTLPHAPLLSLLAALALLALAARSDARQPRAPRRGRALPVEVATVGKAGPGVVALRAPAPERIHIAGGEFTMGSSTNELLGALDLCRQEAASGVCDLLMFRESELHEKPVHPDELIHNEQIERRVKLSPYWIDQHEVTVAEYLRCVEAGPCRKPPYEAGAMRFARPDYPVSYVTWTDARTYCAWAGKRLPTEAEWERAAAGAQGRVFPWGNLYNRRVANHGAMATGYQWVGRGRREKMSTLDHDGRDGFLELSPVGSFPDGRTPDGIDDLAGNVAEWVSDLYEPQYRANDVVDPQGPASAPTPFRVIRGGSYVHSGPWLRARARLMASPDERFSWLGFRCAAGS